MRVSFCCYSNRPQKLRVLRENYHLALHPAHTYEFCLSAERSYTKEDIAWFEKSFSALPCFSTKWAYRAEEGKGTKLFNCVVALVHATNLANDPDYMIVVDDDFRFTEGTHHNNFNSGERYNDAIEYMEQHRDCGVVYMKGFLGGSTKGREIVPMCSGFFETGKGMVIRGSRRPVVDPLFNVPGAGNDVALGVTSLMNGYYIAKALNTPTNTDPNKKLWVPGHKSKKHVVKHPHYSLEYVATKGIFGVISKNFGEFWFGKKLPEPLLEEYRTRTKEMGYAPVY